MNNILPGLDSRMNNLPASESDHKVFEIVHEAEFSYYLFKVNSVQVACAKCFPVHIGIKF